MSSIYNTTTMESMIFHAKRMEAEHKQLYFNSPSHVEQHNKDFYADVMSSLLTVAHQKRLRLSQTSAQQHRNIDVLCALDSRSNLEVDSNTTRDYLYPANSSSTNFPLNRESPSRIKTSKTYNDEWRQKSSCSSYVASRNGHNQPRTMDWEDRLQMLTEFKNKHGHCMVPQRHPQLGTWVKWQREKYALYEKGKTSYITPEKIEALNKLGFVWRLRKKRKARERGIESDTESQSSTTSGDANNSSCCFARSNKSKRVKQTQQESSQGIVLDHSVSHLNDTKKESARRSSFVTVKVSHQEHSEYNPSENSTHKTADTDVRENSGVYSNHLPRKNQEMNSTFNIRRQMEKEMTCQVCSGIYVKYSVCASCNHSFCASCVETSHCRRTNQCPICQIQKPYLIPLSNMDNVILSMIKCGFFTNEAVSQYLKRKFHE